MPYDNDLAPWTTPIVQMLTQGMPSGGPFVAVEADGGPSGHLVRTAITSGRALEQILDATDSSSSENLGKYLDWALSEVSAERWALVVLGHSGGPDEISPDLHPGGPESREVRWMRIDDLDRELKRFGRATGRPLELLFLQNCCKGALEVHYALRSAARYTLSSQLPIGVPNFYYEPVLGWLGGHAGQDGVALARAIMESDRDDMFGVYAVTDNATLDELATRLNGSIELILSSDPSPVSLRSVRYPYGSHWFADLIAFFELALGPLRATDGWDRLADFVRQQVVAAVRHSSRVRSDAYCGLSLLVPPTRAELDRYANLEAWRHIRLRQLLTAVISTSDS